MKYKKKSDMYKKLNSKTICMDLMILNCIKVYNTVAVEQLQFNEMSK